MSITADWSQLYNLNTSTTEVLYELQSYSSTDGGRVILPTRISVSEMKGYLTFHGVSRSYEDYFHVTCSTHASNMVKLPCENSRSPSLVRSKRY